MSLIHAGLVILLQITNAKSVIDNRLPALYTNVPSNLKKLHMEEERQAVIEKENRILLTKIANIMNAKCRTPFGKSVHAENTPRR